MSFHIEVSVAKQQLTLLQDCIAKQVYSISTALKGVGEQHGSFKTPCGWHVIRAKIGQDMPINTVFVGRRPTGEIYSSDMPLGTRDWILTRIMWLSGLELNKNRLGEVDTMRRYIYIHGSPDAVAMGVPGSRGCIRMRNQDVVDLFDRITVGMRVFIGE